MALTEKHGESTDIHMTRVESHREGKKNFEEKIINVKGKTIIERVALKLKVRGKRQK